MMNNKVLVTYLTFLFVFLFSIPAKIFAAYIGSPLESIEKNKWIVAVEENLIRDKKLNVSSEDTTVPAGGSYATEDNLDDCNQGILKVGYGVIDNLLIYLKLGVADWKIKTKWSDGSRTNLEYTQEYLWGGGCKYVYTIGDTFIIGADLQYLLQSDNDVDYIEENGVKATRISKAGKADFKDYQVSIFCGKKFEIIDKFGILPYVGLYYDKFEYKSAEIEYETDLGIYTITNSKLEGDKTSGFLLGTDLILNKDCYVDIEGKFSAEDSIAVGISFLF